MHRSREIERERERENEGMEHAAIASLVVAERTVVRENVPEAEAKLRLDDKDSRKHKHTEK
jgi:hypothetical protein